MNRRKFILILSGAAALLGVARPGRAECGEPTSAEFVEALYVEQARLHAAGKPLGEDKFYALFSRELRQLMRAPRHYPRDQLIDAPLLNAFFGRGVLPRTEVKIGKVALVSGSYDGPATVSVEVSYRGERHENLVRVVQENGVWRIADISYDSGRSLADHYRLMTQH